MILSDEYGDVTVDRRPDGSLILKRTRLNGKIVKFFASADIAVQISNAIVDLVESAE